MHHILNEIDTVNEVAAQLIILSMNVTIEAVNKRDIVKAFALIAGKVSK